MSPDTDIHIDVAAHLLGSLTEREQKSFDGHLQGCERCRREAAELSATADAFDAAREVRDATAPAGITGRVMAAVTAAAAADAGGDPAPREEAAPPAERRSRARRSAGPTFLRRLFGSPAGALAAAACAAGVIFLATAWLTLGGGDESGPEGNLEVAGTMVATDGGEGSARVDVRETGIGREIEFDSDDLPILPTGEYYELWFVGPGDTPEDPNRISAGTFHPDRDGRSQLNLKAAVDPAKYPVLEVTAEPGDGDPAVNGPEVLRLDSRD